MKREEYICKDIAYNNAKVAELCGYPKVLITLENIQVIYHIPIYPPVVKFYSEAGEIQ